MNNRPDSLSDFANDIYDVLGMNTNHQTQRGFFEKYVEDDTAFMIDEYKDVAYIYFDDFKITIERS